MQEFVKSLSSLTLALTLLSVKELENLATPRERGERRGPATRALDSVTHATTDQFGETLRSAFSAADNVQRGLIGLGFSFFLPFLGNAGGSAARRRTQDSKPAQSSGYRNGFPGSNRVVPATVLTPRASSL